MKPNKQSFRIAFLLASVLCAGVATQEAQAQTYALTNLFTVPTGTGNLGGSATTNRGIAYDPVSNLVYVASSSAAAPTIGAYDGTAGTYDGAFNMTGVSGGTTFALDQIGVAADGAIYGINLDTSSSSANKLYRWANWTTAASVAFSGNALINGSLLPTSYTSGRIGDTLAVTGSGANTLILCGVGAKPYFILFYPTDGTGLVYTNTIINVASGLAVTPNVFGLTFYTNNTFLVKPTSSSSDTLYLVQYPANFAGQAVVTGTVLASTATLGTAFNNTTMLSYSPGTGFLGAVQTGNTPTTPVDLFNATNSFSTGLTLLATTNPPTSYNGGNATGGAAVGGKGMTNLYAYSTGDALYAFKILTIPSIPPAITTAPAGGTVYVSDTLSVVATGTAPFSYFWEASGNDTTNAASFTNILGATNSSFNVAAGTNYYEVIITNIAGAVTSAPVQVAIIQPVTNSVVTTLWSAGAGTYSSFLLANDATRGIAYDTNTSNVVVTTTTGAYILNGNTGAYTNATLSTATGTYGSATYLLDQVGIADDGAVYAGNLAVAGQTFNLTRWPAPTNGAIGTTAFEGDPGNDGAADRWGDSMAVRGAGLNTQILLSSKSGTVVSLLTTADGMSFSATAMTITNVPAGFAGNGIAFGAGNTFWAKKYGGDLYEIAYDPVALTNAVLFDYAASSQYPYAMSGVAVDATNNIVSGVDLADVNNDLQLFQLTGSANPPVLFDQAFFPTYNANGNENAAVVMKSPRAYALDVNNGIVAVTYGVPATTAPSISQPPASQSVYIGEPVTMSVTASGSLPLYYQWQFNSMDIPNATNQSYSISAVTTNNAGPYDVVVHNIGGSVTSTPPAVLTVLLPVVSTNNVTNLYTLAAGSRPYLDTQFGTRGLGYDTNYGYLYIAETAGNIFVLTATNGADVGALNTAGLPTTGYAGFILDQVGVGDDGVVYGANLANTLNGDKFSITSWTPVDANPADDSIYPAYPAGDPGNGSGDRWGDDMSVRGAGTNTQLLFGSYTGSNVVLFTTANGTDFTPTLLTLSDSTVTPGFAGAGIAFGAGNTFWAKGGHFFNLRLIAFNAASNSLTVLQTFTAGTQTPNDFVGLSMDVKAGILGGVCLNDSPNDFQLYQVFANSNAPALFDQEFFASQNANSQDNAASTLKGGLGFALDVNNGLVALSYSPLSALASFNITSEAVVPGPGFTLTFNSVPGYTYQVEVSTNLASTNAWSDLGAPISATGYTTTYTDTNDAGMSAAYYKVIGY